MGGMAETTMSLSGLLGSGNRRLGSMIEREKSKKWK
jgi:hypothetical protein